MAVERYTYRMKKQATNIELLAAKLKKNPQLADKILGLVDSLETTRIANDAELTIYAGIKDIGQTLFSNWASQQAETRPFKGCKRAVKKR